MSLYNLCNTIADCVTLLFVVVSLNHIVFMPYDGSDVARFDGFVNFDASGKILSLSV